MDNRDYSDLQFNNISVEDYKKGKPLTPTAVHMDGSEVSLIKLSDGSVVSRDYAIQLVEQGLLNGYVVGVSKYGEQYLRGIPDGDNSNNLQELPKF